MTNLYKLTLAKFLGSLYFAIPVQTIFFFKIGLSFAQVMWLESILLAGILLFEVPTGMLGDKIGRKKSLALGAIASLLAWIPWFLAKGFPLFALSYLISGIAIAFWSGSDQALIYDDLKSQGQESKMQKLYGVYTSSFILASAIAGLVGGLIASSHTMDSFYFIYKLSVAMEILGLIVLLTVKEAPITRKGEEKEHAPEEKLALFRDGLRLLRTNDKLQRILFLSTFSTPFSIVLIYIFQPYFKLAQVPNEHYGIAVFISSLLAVGAKLFAHKIEAMFGVNKGTLIVTLLPAIMWSLMALVFHPIFAVILFILNSGLAEMREPIFADYFNRHIPSYNRATVLSTISMVGSLYQLIMRPILGYLADFNLSYAFAAIALIIAFGSLAFRIKEAHIKVS